jgi:GNAT superfamily N-acetyltransferase
MSEMSDNRYRMPQLSDEFVYQVIFCMEDQANRYVLDLETGDLLTVDEAGDIEQQRYMSLPEWRPADGFRVMEKFVATLRNPVYRQRLHDALTLGKGVFRQFKNVLKEQPAVERLWYYFKEREIKKAIYTWYKQGSEVLYLNAIGEPEENLEELILTDFVLTNDTAKWKDYILKLGSTKLRSEFLSLGYPLSEIIADEYERIWDDFDESYLSVIMESPAGEFAGFLSACPRTADDSVLVYDIRHIYVEPQYRGLGMFKLMTDTLCEQASGQGAERVLIQLLGTASILSHTLFNRGFTLIGQRFALDLESFGLRKPSGDE